MLWRALPHQTVAIFSLLETASILPWILPGSKHFYLFTKQNATDPPLFQYPAPGAKDAQDTVWQSSYS